jgi:hypothetical protein
MQRSNGKKKLAKSGKRKGKNGGLSGAVPPIRAKPVGQKQSIPLGTAQGRKTRAPVIRTLKASTLVCHTEYLLDLPSTTTFELPANQIIVIQPGLVDSMPWLAQVAASYEMYTVRKMVFQYRNRVATNAAGTCYMAYQNDSEDAPFSSKQAMMGYEGSQEQAFYVSQDYHVKAENYMKRYFLRTGPLSSGQDNQLYDLGQFSITAISNTAQVVAGELLVYYEIEFYKPKISQALGAGYYANLTSGGADIATLQAHPFSAGGNTVTSQIPYSGYYDIAATGSSDTITFNSSGVYLLTADWNAAGTQTTSLASSIALGDNVTTSGGIHSNNNYLGGSSQNVYNLWCLIVVSGGPVSENTFNMFFSGGAGLTNWTCFYAIVQLSPGAIFNDESLKVKRTSLVHSVFHRMEHKKRSLGGKFIDGEPADDDRLEPPPLMRQLLVRADQEIAVAPRRSESKTRKQ